MSFLWWILQYLSKPTGVFRVRNKHLSLEAPLCNLRAADLLALQITNPIEELKIWVEALCPKWNALQNGCLNSVMLQIFFFFEQQKIPASLAGLYYVDCTTNVAWGSWVWLGCGSIPTLEALSWGNSVPVTHQLC